MSADSAPLIADEAARAGRSFARRAHNAWRGLVLRAERRARASFDMPSSELAEVNGWLIPKSRLICFFIIGFFSLLALAGVAVPLGWIALLCGFALVMSLPFRAWLDSGRALALLVYAQFTFDIVILTIGLVHLPVLLHLQMLMVIIPAALLSRQCGIIMTGLAIVAHLVMVRLAGTTSPTEVLGPIYFFVIVAHECLFYGARLTAKTHQAEDESRVAAVLLRVADELAASRTSAALVQRLAVIAKELSGGCWTAVVLYDAERKTFAVRALVSRMGIIDEEVLSVEALPFPMLDPRRLNESADGCVLVESAATSLLPRELHERWRAGSYLASVLRRGDDPVGMLLVGFDDTVRLHAPVTRRLVVGMARQALLALENARLFEDLQRASVLKSEFIGTISHELRSPLHAIIGYTEILRDEAAEAAINAAPSTPANDMLDRIHVHALHLHEMIEATLAVSRLESGRLPMRVATVSPTALFAEIAAEIPEFRLKPGVKLEWRVALDLPPIETDPGKLKMIVRNLVDNALKFTEIGHVIVAVRLGHEPDDDAHDEATACLSIVVSDTGIGIAPELRATVFEMYRQGDGSMTRRHAGVGLGLYIVKRLVEVMRGRILLESSAGDGTSIHVTLPVRVAAEDVIEVGIDACA